MAKYRNPYRSLKNRKFRYFWYTQSISLIGTWIDTTLRGWVAVNLFSENKAAGFIGLIALLKGLPSIFLSPVAGVLIDWFSPKTVLFISQFVDTINAFIMAYFVYKGYITPTLLMFLSLAMGITSGFYLPSRNVFISSIVDRENLPNALAMHAMIFNLARMIGPSVAGIIVKAYGLEFGFIVNAISFLPLLVVLLFIRTDYQREYSGKRNFKKFLADLKNGLKYASKDIEIMLTLLNTATYSLFGMIFGMLMQAYAKTVIKSDLFGYSLIMGAMGLGALIGATIVASIEGTNVIKIREEILLIIIGTSIILSAVAPQTTAFFAIIIGACQSSFFNVSNSRIQFRSPLNMRGRLMSLYSFINTGGSPLGTFIMGLVGNLIGIKNAYFLSGIILLSYSSVIFKMKSKI